MDEIRDAILKLPVCIPPPVVTPRPNIPLEFYETDMVLSGGDSHATGSGRIWFSWVPRAGPRFEIQTDGGLRALEDLGSTHLSLSDPQAEFGVLVTTLGSDDADVAGVINDNARFGELSDSDPVSSISFVLTNFHHYHGAPIRPEGKELKTWAGRWSIEADPWKITIDEIEDCSDLRKQLEREGGYAVTHAGRLERIDGSSSSLREAEQVLDGLRCFLGFCRGMWCGPVFPTYFADGRSSNSLAPWHLTRWRHVGSWFPRFGPLSHFSPAVARFLALWADEDWRGPIQHYIWWYIEANLAATLESAIVKIQAALELMGWLVLVEQDHVISADGFNKLPASDKIRLLLTHLDIPITIPDHLANLKGHAKSIQEDTGAGAFVFLRNAIVHPSLKKRRRLKSVKNEAKFEATQLGRQYLEFILLSLLHYEGKYEDRTDTTRWAGIGDDVPWKGNNGNA